MSKWLVGCWWVMGILGISLGAWSFWSNYEPYEVDIPFRSEFLERIRQQYPTVGVEEEKNIPSGVQFASTPSLFLGVLNPETPIQVRFREIMPAGLRGIGGECSENGCTRLEVTYVGTMKNEQFFVGYKELIAPPVHPHWSEWHVKPSLQAVRWSYDNKENLWSWSGIVGFGGVVVLVLGTLGLCKLRFPRRFA